MDEFTKTVKDWPATGCIGRDTAIVFAVSGARGIILAYENVGDVENIDNLIVELEIVKTNINCVISPKNVNLADNILVQDMVSNVATNLERIDYVVHCAGVSQDISKLTEDALTGEFAKSLAINAQKSTLCARAAANAMVKQEPFEIDRPYGKRGIGRCSIIIVASASPHMDSQGLFTYTISKRGIDRIMEATVSACLNRHVRINAIFASCVDAPMGQQDMTKEPVSEEVVDEGLPLGRRAWADEVGNCIVFLSSAAASYVNGATLVIDGGFALSRKCEEVVEELDSSDS